MSHACLASQTCPPNEGCQILTGNLGSFDYNGNDSFDFESQTYRSAGQRDSYWQVSGCREFDCSVLCHTACTCRALGIDQECPRLDGNTSPAPKPTNPSPTPVVDPNQPQRFQNLQDVRLTCPRPGTRCEISGYNGCGYSDPGYNMFNSNNGMFVVQDPSRGRYYINLRACHPGLGSALCDAGCTCQDLATSLPCDSVPTPSLVPETQPVGNLTILFSGMKKAEITCLSLHTRCDEPSEEDYGVCGASIVSGRSDAVAFGAGPGRLRVDQCGRGGTRSYTAAFRSCDEENGSFSMVCDARCTCVDTSTDVRRPCDCVDSATGQSCTSNSSVPPPPEFCPVIKSGVRSVAFSSFAHFPMVWILFMSRLQFS